MTRATLPEWPRGMNVELAAAYVGLSPGTFRSGVEAGMWPEPMRIGKRTIWDRARLDEAVDKLSGRGQVDRTDTISKAITRYGENRAQRR